MANIRKYILHIPNDQLNTILTKVQQGVSGADDLFCSTLYPDVEKYCEGKVKDDDMKFSSVIFPDISRFRTFMIMIFSEGF